MGRSHLSISAVTAAPIFGYLSRPENAWKSNKQLARELGTVELKIRRAKHKYKWGQTVRLTIKKMRRDAGLQPRSELDQVVVDDYAEKMRSGTQFVPPTVFFDGTSYWLADGFHRAAAALLAGIKSLHVEVIQGDKRDAKLFAAGANAEHGLRRSNADKRRSVLSLLSDEEWGARADNWIAGKCKVSHTFVENLRRETGRSTCNVASAPVRQCSDGRTMNTVNIGRKPAPRQDAEPSTNGYHEPEPVEPETAGAIAEPEPEMAPWPFSLGVSMLAKLIARHFATDALEALLRDLAGRAGFTLTPIDRG